MANAKSANVWRVDTTAVLDDVRIINAIKYIGNTSGTAEIRASGSASGQLIWEEEGTANILDADLCIKDNQGIHVTVTNGAVLYIYME